MTMDGPKARRALAPARAPTGEHNYGLAQDSTQQLICVKENTVRRDLNTQHLSTIYRFIFNSSSLCNVTGIEGAAQRAQVAQAVGKNPGPPLSMITVK